MPFTLFAWVGAFVSMGIEFDGGWSKNTTSSFGNIKVLVVLSLICFYLGIFLALVGVEEFYVTAKFSMAISTASVFFQISGKTKANKFLTTVATLISAFALAIVILQYIAYAPLTKSIWTFTESIFLVCKFFLFFGVGKIE